MANLVRDRKLLALGKTEPARFAATIGEEAVEEERAQIQARLQGRWQRRYGLARRGKSPGSWKQGVPPWVRVG